MNQSIHIQPACSEDASALSDLGGLTFSETFAHLYDPEDLAAFLASDHSIEAYQSALNDPATKVWKAVSETGRFLGYAVATRTCGLPVNDMPEYVGEVKRLYVRQGIQNAGTGQRLMDAMMAWLLSDGPRPIYLSVYKYNSGAQRFYERYGFEYLKEYKYMVGSHADPEYVFWRPSR